MFISRWYKSLALFGFVALVGIARFQTLTGSFTWADNGHLCELYSTSGISYEDATAFAVTSGGYLATVTTVEENDAVTLNLGA